LTTTKATTKTKAKRSEHVEQREFVMWMRQTHPEHRIFAIPNGGRRGTAEAGRLKAEGVSAGVPDLYVPSLKLWIEMKAAGGRVEPEQADWHAYLRGIGDRVEVCWCKEEAIAAVARLVLR
jgi:hypothetical protein